MKNFKNSLKQWREILNITHKISPCLIKLLKINHSFLHSRRVFCDVIDVNYIPNSFI